MTLQEAHRQLLFALYALYDNREAANIADIVVERVTGQRRIDRIMNKQIPIGPALQSQLEQYTAQLLQHTPVQYVLHEAWFGGLLFYVDENVLIPRPETEELVEWIGSQIPLCSLQFPVKADDKGQPPTHTNNITPSLETGNRKLETPFSLLDIGTGSGCIPIVLKKKFPDWAVYALDVSPGALQVAQKNADMTHAVITFYEADILNQTTWPVLPMFDVIVSNPPYIRLSESEGMLPNVTQFEPHTALFVPDDDALLFYKKIADFAQQYLQPNGQLFFEINESFGVAVCNMLANKGFVDIELKKDMQGKDRLVRAQPKKQPPTP